MENFYRLLTLCEFPLNQKWNLIYRASRDGFKASQFHAKCDNKPNTLIIIKSTNDNVFGRYTEQSWTPFDYDLVLKQLFTNRSRAQGLFNRSSDPNAFIFSLINYLNRPLKIKCENSLPATSTNRDFGPRFVLHELIISDESNTNM